MALTGPQKTSLYRFLGWSFHDRDAWKLEQRIVELEGRASDEASVISLLTLCEGVMTAIAGSAGRLKVTQLGPIQLRGHYELAWHRTYGRQLAGQVADLLGVEKKGDAFGPSRGHEAGFPGAGTGSWNYPPHG